MRVVIRKNESIYRQLSYAALATGRASGVWVADEVLAANSENQTGSEKPSCR